MYEEVHQLSSSSFFFLFHSFTFISSLFLLLSGCFWYCASLTTKIRRIKRTNYNFVVTSYTFFSSFLLSLLRKKKKRNELTRINIVYTWHCYSISGSIFPLLLFSLSLSSLTKVIQIFFLIKFPLPIHQTIIIVWFFSYDYHLYLIMISWYVHEGQQVKYSRKRLSSLSFLTKRKKNSSSSKERNFEWIMKWRMSESENLVLQSKYLFIHSRVKRLTGLTKNQVFLSSLFPSASLLIHFFVSLSSFPLISFLISFLPSH